MKNKLMDFVETLALQKVGKQTFNQYSEDNFPGFFTTKLNLLLYLTQMNQRKPKTMLLGEAPGYKGCKLTGVPFTSERIISRSNRFDLFGYSEDIWNLLEERNVKLQTESTATIVWEILEKYNFCPLLWNSYPFYTFDKKNDKPNRQPSEKELKEGQKFTIELIKIFKIKNIIALGKSAQRTLDLSGIPYFPVKHPAYGNKEAFEKEIKKLLQEKKIL